MRKVVVVESPAKAKTISHYLGKDFAVVASYGHVRDLPSKNGSVLPDKEFNMVWEVDEKAQKHISYIAKQLAHASDLFLATDPDREGEAIAWHVQEVLKAAGYLTNIQIKRIVFHEITKSAIQQALKQPRSLNQELVEAYLARRALDYLVGFTLSPVLWRKLPGARSAGRVQSVALRLIVERETSIESFKSQEYWSVVAHLLNPQGVPFTARLTHLQERKLDKLDLKSAQEAEAACEAVRHSHLCVESIDKKQVKRQPASPFITSTLQQEASRKLGFSAQRTMQTAQRLYEGVDINGESTGLITYMRTDSVHLSTEALNHIRSHIVETFGSNYLPSEPRFFKNKVKNAQEAHEAIRPTQVSRHPKDLEAYLDESQYKLYELIWKRTIACQMDNALFNTVTVTIAAKEKSVQLRATGSTLIFDGFLKVYQESVDEGHENEEAETLLPPLQASDELSQQEVVPHQHFTQPPPRYSEASLVKQLEELGIGRPSTYASILQVLQDRQYVRLEKRHFIPEDRGRLVTVFLINFFRRYVEYDFTAQLEQQLDEISSGHLYWKNILTDFWQNFHTTVKETQELSVSNILETIERDLSFYLYQSHEDSARLCPSCQKGQLGLKLSKFGAFLGCNQYPECRYTRPIGTEAQEDLAKPVEHEPVAIGKDPETGELITLRKGPYGHYLQWGDLSHPAGKTKKKVTTVRRISVPSMIDPATVTMDVALRLKELPKEIGNHPETNLPISIGIGRFGPYVKYGDKFISIPRTKDFLELTMAESLDLIVKKTIRVQKPSVNRKKKTLKSKK